MKRRAAWCGLACAAVAACALFGGVQAAEAQAQARRVPWVVGLAAVRSVAEPHGDHEAINTNTFTLGKPKC